MKNFATILTTKALTIGYQANSQRRVVAQDLHLHLPTGQLICLLGPNGSGKTTLLRTLSGTQAPLSGSIYLNHQPLANFTPAQRATQLAVALTEPMYAHNLSGYDLVAMGRYPYTGWLGRLTQDDHQAVERAMEATDTTAFAARPVSTLSDGERQKIMIARALAQDTPVLMLDEPTAHLDLPNRIATLQLLRRLAQEFQKAIVLSTHSLDLALLLADHVWLIHQGAVHTGVPEDLALNGTIAQVFAQGEIRFDRSTGTFGVTPPTGTRVRLTGPMPEHFWTQRALERVGYTVTEHTDTILSVEILSGDTTQWVIRKAEKQQFAGKIAQLLTILRNHLS